MFETVSRNETESGRTDMPISPSIPVQGPSEHLLQRTTSSRNPESSRGAGLQDKVVLDVKSSCIRCDEPIFSSPLV